MFAPRFVAPALSLLAILAVKGARAGPGRSLTSGIAYPTLADAVQVNPGALTDEKGGPTVARLAYEDPYEGYAGMLAGSSESSGMGIALNTAGARKLTLGGGYGGQTFRLGLNLSLAGMNPGDADFGLGASVGRSAGFRFAATMSALNDSTANRLTIGIGYAVPRSYQIELDLSAPMASLSNAGKPCAQTLEAIAYYTSFGIGIFESSPMGLKEFGVGTMDFGGVVQYHWSARTSIDLRYSTSGSGTIGFGVLASF